MISNFTYGASVMSPGVDIASQYGYGYDYGYGYGDGYFPGRSGIMGRPNLRGSLLGDTVDLTTRTNKQKRTLSGVLKAIGIGIITLGGLFLFKKNKAIKVPNMITNGFVKTL